MNDGSLDQTVPNMSSPSQGSPNSQERIEHYSRKVFVGGLPPDIDEGQYIEKFTFPKIPSIQCLTLIELVYVCMWLYERFPPRQLAPRVPTFQGLI